jgi:hypothetical protein
VGNRLSPLEHLCIKSFLTHGHRFVLYVYGEVKNVPPGCALEDATTILPEERVFLQRSGMHVGSPSTFSNQFRYELLRARGGWWTDTDILCLKATIQDTPYVFAKEDEETYNCAVLKAPAESDFLREAIKWSSRVGGDAGFAEIGPTLVSKLVRDLRLESFAWRREELYPVRWQNALELFDPTQADRLEAEVASSTFLHLWTNMLRVANVLRDVRPPESSYLDRRYSEYQVEFPDDRRYEWAQVQPQYRYQRVHLSVDAEIARLERLATEQEHQTVRLHQRLAATEAEVNALRDELTAASQERLRVQGSITIQLFHKLSERVYGVLGRESILGRALQASLRLIGRVFGVSNAA